MRSSAAITLALLRAESAQAAALADNSARGAFQFPEPSTAADPEVHNPWTEPQKAADYYEERRQRQGNNRKHQSAEKKRARAKIAVASRRRNRR